MKRVAVVLAFVSAAIADFSAIVLLFTDTDHPARIPLGIFSAVVGCVMAWSAIGLLRGRHSAAWTALVVAALEFVLVLPGMVKGRAFSLALGAVSVALIAALAYVLQEHRRGAIAIDH